MTYPLEFKQKFVYQENERGIFIPLTLAYGAKTTACGAKLDMGADFCYFVRFRYAGLDVVPSMSSQRTEICARRCFCGESFQPFGLA